MATLICDITTKGESFDSFDEKTKHALTEWIDRRGISDTHRKLYRQNVLDTLGLSPLTGSMLSLGLYDLERGEGVLFSVSDTATDVEESAFSSFMHKSRTEATLLRDFWDGVCSYDTVVTFNGRRFDIPFLLTRSAVYGIVPTCDLMESRYLAHQHSVRHIDLQDQLSFYGATRRQSLHLFCRAFGITPQQCHEVPSHVSAPSQGASAQNEREKLVALNKNICDVMATVELYERWRRYIAPHIPTLEE
jgi:3'-5' exonuclease